MSLTVALKISFRDDSRRIFRSFDLAILHRRTAAADNSPDGSYTVQNIWRDVGVYCPAAVYGTKQKQSPESDGTRLLWFCFAKILRVCSAPAGVGCKRRFCHVTHCSPAYAHKYGHQLGLNYKNCKFLAALYVTRNLLV